MSYEITEVTEAQIELNSSHDICSNLVFAGGEGRIDGWVGDDMSAIGRPMMDEDVGIGSGS